MMDILKLYKDHNVPIAGPGQRHYRHGWVNTPCPFCTGSGKPGNHLGFCIDPSDERLGSFVCYRCGGKRIKEAISALLRISEDQARKIIAAYGGFSAIPAIVRPKAVKYTREAQLPPRTKRIQDIPGALKYILGRRFDPDYLEQIWGVRATGPGSVVNAKDGDKSIRVDYSYRLIIPVLYKGKLVTYQGRDWTGKTSPKYKAAHPYVESIAIKDLLYGLDEAEGISTGILVEGVTDVWRIGVGAIACFGIKYREPQVRLLKENFKAIKTLFDTEPQAKIQALKIVKALVPYMPVDWVKLPKGKDPADLTTEEIKELLK